MDPIADMITMLKNAGNAGRESFVIPSSRIKKSIAEVLRSEGFIKGYKEKEKSGKPVIEIELLLENRVPKIQGVKRISKVSKRVYKKSSELRSVKNGYGVLVVSTPKGVMSGRQAKKESLGGEALFSIW